MFCPEHPVEVSDGGGLTDTATLTINLNDINETPVIENQTFTLDENSDVNSIVGQVVASDVDQGDTLTYHITNSASLIFDIATDTGIITVKDSSHLDYESQASITLNIEVRDQGNLKDRAKAIITLNDVNEVPAISIENLVSAVQENTDTTTPIKIADIQITDDDLGIETLTLVGDHAHLFEINNLALYIKSGTSLDHETIDTLHGSIQVDDNTVGATPDDSVALAIAITDINETPTVDQALIDVTVDEDAADQIIDLSNLFADVDADDSLTLSVASSNESLVTTTINGTTLTLSFASDQNGSATITVTATDNGALQVSDTLTLTVNPINDAPIVSSPFADVTVDEDAIDQIIDLSSFFTDVDDSTLNFSVINNNTSLVTTIINGAELTLQLGENQNGLATITVTATDSGNLQISDSFNLTVNAINDNPSVVNPLSDLTIDEDATDQIIDLSSLFADVEDSSLILNVINTNASLVTATINNTNLILSLAENQNGLATITVTATDSGNLKVSDSLTLTVQAVNDTPTVVNPLSDLTIDEDAADQIIDLSNLFADVEDSVLALSVVSSNESLVSTTINGTTLTLSLPADQNGSALITVTATDSGNLEKSNSFNLTVHPVNDAPVLAIPFADLMLDEDAADQIIDLSNIFADVDGDILSFNAISSNDSLVTVAIDGTNLVLALAENQNGFASITVTATDLESLQVSDLFDLSVNPVNDAPVVVDQTFAIAENSSIGSLVGGVQAHDVEADPFTYSIISGNEVGTFSIDADSGNVTVAQTEDLDFETTPSFTLQVQVTDLHGLTTSALLTINLLNLNEYPVVLNQSLTIDENSANETIAGIVLATDQDAGDTRSYAITGGTGATAFAIDITTGEITVTDYSQLDYETVTSFTLNIQVTDLGGLTDTATLTIQLSDINETPSINDQTLEIAENSANGTIVDLIQAIDVDADDQLKYTVQGGTGSNAFLVGSKTGQITVANTRKLDYETRQSFTLQIQVTDLQGLADIAVITINLTNANEAPTLDDYYFTIDENSANATLLGTVQGIDIDANDLLTYTIISGTGTSAFNLNQNTGEITINDATQLDYETTSRFILYLQVTDGGMLTDTAQITIDLNDINETPVIHNQTFAIDEYTPNATSVGEVLASDQDNNDSLSYAITGGTGSSAFAIDNLTGQITVTDIQQLNYKYNQSLTLELEVSDQQGLTGTAQITIQINKVHDLVLSIEGDLLLDIEVDGIVDVTTTGTITVQYLIASGQTIDLDAGEDLLINNLDIATQGQLNATATENINFTVPLRADYSLSLSADNITLNELTTTDNASLQINNAGLLTINHDITLDGSFIQDGTGAVSLGANITTTQDHITFNGAVTLINDVTLHTNDVIAPVISEPADITAFEATGTLSPVDIGDAIATDDSLGKITLTTAPITDGHQLFIKAGIVDTLTHDALDTFIIGTTIVTWTATDTNGNSSTVQQIVTVVDTIAPVLSLPEDLIIEATGPQTPITLAMIGVATATDVVGVQSSFSDVDTDLLLAVNQTRVITWTAIDTVGNTTSDTQTITVVDTTPPAIENQTFDIDENSDNNTQVGTVQASDVGSADALTYAIIGGTENSAFAIDPDTAKLTVKDFTQLDYETTPSFIITIEVTDQVNLTSTAQITIHLNDLNDAPILQTIGDQTVDEETTLALSVIAIDADDNPANTLTYSLDTTSLATGMTIDSTTGEFLWTPTEQQQGEHTVIITVTDNGTDNLTDSETITITVNEINDAPVLDAIGNQIVDEEATLSFTVTAADSNDDPTNNLAYSLDVVSIIAGMTIDSSTGEFVWTPTELQQGDHTVTITVTDDGTGNLTDSETITITVNEINDAPILDTIGYQIIDEEVTLSFTVIAADSNDDPANNLIFTLDAASIAAGMTIDPTTGEFVWTSTEYQDGEHTVTITVTDDGIAPLNDSETIVITVNEVNDAPVIENQSFAVNEYSVNGTVVGIALASDVDTGDVLSYAIIGGTGATAFAIDSATGQITVIDIQQLNYRYNQNLTLDLEVSDLEGVSDTAIMTIDINKIHDLILDIEGDLILDIEVDGIIDVTVTGTITVEHLVALGGTINLIASQNIHLNVDVLDEPISANEGNITLNSEGVIELLQNTNITTGPDHGNIHFNSPVNGDYKLGLIAGTGDIDFDREIALGGLQVTSASNLTFDNTVTVDDEGIDITAGNVTLSNVVTTTGSGDVEITNSGLLTIANAADMTLDGSFTQNGTGAVSMGSSITTTNDNIRFAQQTTLINDIVLSTDTGTGNVAFGSNINSAEGTNYDLIINAGQGNVYFDREIGTNDDLGTLKIEQANDVIVFESARTHVIDLNARQIYIDGVVVYSAEQSNLNAQSEVIINGVVESADQLNISATDLYLMAQGQLKAARGNIDVVGEILEVTYLNPVRGQRLFDHPYLTDDALPEENWWQTDWYTTHSTNIDQIGWIDPATMQTYEAGVSGQALISNTLYEIDYSAGTNLTKLYEASYILGSGEYHMLRNGEEHVLVEESEYLTNNHIATQAAPEFEGYIYMERSVYEAHRAELIDLEYVPEWSNETTWEIVHASEFLGENYDAANPEHNFYVKIQINAKTYIQDAVVSQVEEITQEDIGETRLVTNLNLHQIGWWNPQTNEGLRDSRDLAVSPDARTDSLFEIGVAKPGEEWVAWYTLQLVSSQREITLTDGRIYNVEENPTWADSTADITVMLEISGQALYVEIPMPLTEDLESIEWIADLTEEGGVVIPVDAIQIDNTDDYYMGDYAEYLGTWRDDWGTHRSGDAYSHDNGLREVETIIAQLTNDQGEPGYAIITNWIGEHADRHEIVQNRSYAYIWMRDDWGQHIGATASNTTGLDDIGTVQQGEDDVIDVLDRYEGTASDTHEVWNQYDSAYNWIRDALYIEKTENGHIYGIDKYEYPGAVLDADGNVLSLANGQLPEKIENAQRDMIRALFTLKHNDHSHQVWIYFSAAYKDNQPLENGERDGSTYEEDWVTFKASKKHNTIVVDLSLLDVKEIALIEEVTEEHHHHTHTYYQKVVGGAEVQIKRTHKDKWEIADLATVDGTQVYEWKYSNNLYQAYLNMMDNNYDGGAYRDLLGSYEGAYTTAETELSGRVIGEIEDISNITTNDGTREFLGYTWNQNGTEYQENWQHYSDWYKDFSVGGQAVKSIYDAYVPSIDEQNAIQLIDIWQDSYIGLYTTAEDLIKPIGTIEAPVGNELYPYTGIKTLVGGEWDNGMYHEIWFHESDEYRHYLAPEARTSTYDKVAWEDATASRAWEQVWVGSHLQDQGWYEDNGSWYEQANVNANRENPIGQGNNDQWVQNLTWISNLIHIDDFESRIHTNNDLLYNWHDLLDDRAHYQYRVTTVTEETDQGEVQTVKEQLSGAIEGTVVSLTAGGDVILSTQIETLNAEITGQGGLYIIELDALVLEEILSADGLIEITAVDELIVWKQIKAAHGSIDLTAGSDIEVIGEIIAQGTGAKIALTTPELVVIEGQIKAQDRIEIKAVGTNRVLSIYVKGIVETDPAGSMRLQGDKEILISGQLGTENVDHIEVVTEQNLYLLSEGQIKAQRVELEAWGEIEEVNYQNPERGQRLFIHPVTQQHLRLGTDGQQTEIPSILWVETNWYTTHGVQIDQIGWIDPETMREYEAGVSGQALINKLLYEIDYSVGADLTKLYQAGFITDSGEYHILRNGEEYVLVVQNDDLANNIDAEKTQPAPEFEGYVYVERSEYEAYLNELTDLEYIPEWSTQETWEIVHASEFLGENYDAANPEHDFYVKMQIGAKTYIQDAVVSQIEEITQEDIGETRLVTNLNLHQVGWWNPQTSEGLRDSRDLAVSPDARTDGLFEIGVAKPGEEWVAWYTLQLVSSHREITLTDGRVYRVEENPTWADSTADTTVILEVSGQALYVEIPTPLTEDLESIEWIADLTEEGGVVIPVDAIQIDNTDDYYMGDYAEYLGTWRDDWGTHRSGDAYSHDSGLREMETIIAQLTNDQGEPGYAIITNWIGEHADRHEVVQNCSYAYIWVRDNWGQHIGATANNTTGLDDIGTVQQGEDGVIDVLDRYEGTGSDTHEVWNQYSSAYNWTRDALYIKKASNGHKYGIGEFLYEGIVLDADGNIISLMNGTLPSEIEQVERGMTRALFTLKHNDHSHQVWIYFSAAYKNNQPLENGERDGSTYEENWVTFKASKKHNTITVDLSLLDIKEIASIEEVTEEHHHHTHTYYQKVVGGAEVQIKRTHKGKWEIANLATVDGTQVYEWKYSNNLYQAYQNMTDNNYDGGAYRDLLGSYEGTYTTAETELSGRVVGEIEDISNITTNDGTREFLGYTWNQNGTEYQENWQHYSDWYKDFSISDQAVKSIYDAYVPSIDEQNAIQLIDIWQDSYTGLYTDAESLIKPIATIEAPVGNELYPYTGIKTLVGGEWDNGMYHENWFHESDEYKHYADLEARTSNYDKVAWEDATTSRAWEQVWVDSHMQDQGWYEDHGHWDELANVGADRDNPIGEGHNDPWTQTLVWVSRLVQIDEFEDRLNTNNDLLYNWHNLFDDRAHYQYHVTSVTEETDQGEVQTIKEQLSGAIESTVASLTAGGDIVLSTQIETLNAEITGQGELYITELDALILEETLNADGLIKIEAGDELIVWKQVKATHGSIDLTAGSDIEVIGEIIAQGTGAKIALTTPQLIFVEGHIKASSVNLEAQGINRDLSVYIRGLLETDLAGRVEIQAAKDILIVTGQIGTEQTEQITLETETNIYLISGGQIKGQRIEPDAQKIKEINYAKPQRNQKLFIHPQIEYNSGLAVDGQQVEIPSIQWIETNWYTTHGAQIDQIGWIDPETMREYETGVSGQALIDNVLYEIDYSVGADLTKLYQAGFIAGSGEYHILRNGEEYVLVIQNDNLANSIDTEKTQLAPEFEGYIYVEKSEYQAYQTNLTDMEYIPEWSNETTWEIVHASEFLGENYDAANPEHNFYVKMQIDSKTYIQDAVVSQIEEITQEDIGETRLVTNLNLHQIGWWNPQTSEGLRDSHDLAVSPDVRTDGLFEIGVAKPGEEWMAWYAMEFLSSHREIILTDGRVYSIEENPTWADSTADTTVTLEINGQALYVKIPAPLTEDLEDIEWIADLTEESGVVIPVDAIQIDNTDDYYMGDYAEYLGTWRDDWGTHRSGDAYSHDSGLRELETVIAQLTNDQSEPGYAIITNWTGQNADRHEVVQDRSYAYIWIRDDWGQHIGTTVNNTTGLDDIGTVQQGEDGVIDVLDHYEGTGADTHEIWNQYTSAYNWTRDALYIKKASNGHKYGIGEFLYEGTVLDADGNILSLVNGTLPSEIEQVERGMTRALFNLKHDHRHSHQVWIYFSAAYKDNQPLENGERDGSTYEENWVTFKASKKHNTIVVDLSLLDVKEIGLIEKMTEKHHHHTHTYYQKVVGGVEVQIKRTHKGKWEIADLATVDGTQVYEWKYSNNLYQAYKNMVDNNYDGGAYRDLLGNYEGAYTTAETELNGRVVGEIQNISNVTTNDGTREFLGYTWNQNGTEYQENWQHYSDWYKDFSISDQAVKSIYDAYVPSIDEQNAIQLIDIWQDSYTGLYSDAENLIKPIATIEAPVGNELYPYTGIKTLVGGEWDNGIYHEIWFHESDEYKHYTDPEARTSTYDKIAWEDATATREWEQLLVGSHTQDRGEYTDNGSWDEQANVNADRDNPIGEGNNDQWIQNLEWTSDLVHIDDFEDRIHTNNLLLYNWYDLLDDRDHVQYIVTSIAD